MINREDNHYGKLKSQMVQRIKRMFFTILIGLVIGYFIILGLVYVKQRSMIYYPMKDITTTPADIDLHFEEITLKTQDDIQISAWYIPAENEKGVLLFCHGNAGNISHRLDSIRVFNELNLSVFIFDYRGYGKSKGSPSERGTYLDAESALDYLVRTKRIEPEKIIIFGRSLGGAVASEIAFKHKAGALIIESGFTSVPDVGSDLFPYLPIRLISHFHYSTIDKVRKIRIPKLFIHSPDDDIIPFKHGLKLFEEASEPKEFLQIRGGHNEGFLISDKEYRDGLKKYIGRYL